MFFLLSFLLVLVSSQPPGKPLPSFSSTETGRFIRTYSLTIGQEKDEFFFMLNRDEQRAYVKISNYDTGTLLSEHWLIWEPEGSDVLESSSGFVEFLLQDPNPNDDVKETICQYKTSEKIHFGSGLNYPPIAFPDHWDREDVVEIKSWIEVPEDIGYQGVVTENGFDYDVWISFNLCSISDFGTLPCNKLAFLKDTNIPTAFFIADEATGQFRNSWWLNDEFLYYAPRSDAIYPPQNWLTTCWNTQNGFKISTYGRAFVSTPGHPDTFTIQLNTRPIESLGSVHVSFMFDDDSCQNCIAFEDENENPIEEIIFDSSNWDDPVTVKVHYLNEGETYFFILGYGGGYEIPHYDSHYFSGRAYTVSQGHRALTCEGVAGYGCD